MFEHINQETEQGPTCFQETTLLLPPAKATTASITSALGQACRMQKALRGGQGPKSLSKATSCFFGGSCSAAVGTR